MHTKTKLLLLLLLAGLRLAAQRNSVLIHEIMADPQPPVGLPEAEYIELRNAGSTPINLAGWRLQTATATSGAFPAHLLQPDSFIVITSRTAAGLLGGNTLGVTSFPALPNGGTTLVLRNASGTVVHAVAYDAVWYGNAVKAEGGWSLEMVDAANPCGSGNWKASQHPSGGTPGSRNSVQAPNRDDTPPALLAATAPDSLHLLLHFDEPLDSSSAAIAGRYRVAPDINVAAALPQGPLYQTVLLTLQTPMAPATLYSLTVSQLADCAGNLIGRRNQVPTGLPQPAAAGDVVINELLFNPAESGADYVELLNRRAKIIDASRLWLSNNSSATTQPQRIAADPLYLFPGQYAVLTENRDAVLRSYLIKQPELLWQVASLPSMPDDKGSIALLNEQGITLEACAYSKQWHFALLTNTEGVALERIDPGGPAQLGDNWTSAAASAGFGTPTYQNSQFRLPVATAGTLTISPPVFSPDGDGFDDFCTFSFQLPQPNYVANLRIFDAGGRPVRHLVQNQTLAQSGFWRWDGLNDHRQALPTGTYILLLELFNLEGWKQQFKKTVVLARKLR